MENTATKTDLFGFTGKLFRLWSKAEALYRNGNREPDQYFDEDEVTVLTSLGLNVMDVYDYVEDFSSGGDPDFATFILISSEKVFYFFEELGGVLSEKRISEKDLPLRDAEAGGFVWLPRILVKARAKLRGELPAEIMYGCGGDRKFLRRHGIHPAEFLRKVRYSSTDEEVVDWVARRTIS